MKRTILIAAVVFVIATLAGAGGRVALTRPQSDKKGAGADSTKTGVGAPAPGDSSHSASAALMGGSFVLPQGTEPAAPTVPAMAPGSTPVTEAGTTVGTTPGATPEATPGTEPEGAAGAISPATESPSEATKAAAAVRSGDAAVVVDSILSASADAEAAAKATKVVARILVTMKAADAGRIMAGLTDKEVEGILRALGVRQAAGLLALLPTERASLLSRRLLEDFPKESPKESPKEGK